MAKASSVRMQAVNACDKQTDSRGKYVLRFDLSSYMETNKKRFLSSATTNKAATPELHVSVASLGTKR